MIRKNCLEICGRGASVVLFVLFTFSLVGSGVHAQSAQLVPGGSVVVKPISPPAFLAAPSVPLGYSPTSIASGALTTSGRTDLVTADALAGKITVFTGQGHGTFAPGVAYAAGAQPTSLVVADVDGDGRADVVLANSSEGVISIFPGNGDGTLGARKTYAIGFAPSFVAAGDFTGNGKMDIAVAGAAGKSLAILQNTGAGNFGRPVNFGLTSAPAAIVAADFNHDGHLDLAVAGASGTVTVFLGKGNGQFSVLPDISVASGALSSITVGDFNRDGNLDLVVTSAALNQAAVLLGHGDGKFGAASLLAVGNAPVAAHIADVDGDGIPDLIVVNKGSNTFSVLNGVGDGTFKSAAHFVVGNAPLGAAAADFYGNGRVDLATINQLGQTLSVPAGNGDGTFAAGRAYAAGAQPVSVASGDLTRSGRSDMVVASYCPSDATCGGGGSAAVLMAGPGGVYQLGSTYPMGAGSVGIHLVDVNGDGVLDMVALNRVDKSVSIRLGAGDGTFGSLSTVALSAYPLALAAADFNKDGKIDLAVLGDCGSATCSQPGSVEFLLGTGGGNFHSVSTYTVGFAPVALAVGKTSAAGNADVVVANRCGLDSSCKSGGTATLLLGDGAGAFKPGTSVALGNSPSSIALADLRGTGILDLVVSRSPDNTVAVLPGAGNGTFKAAVPYAVGHAPGTLVIADFNGDGHPDVAVANTADSTISVLFGKAGGTLEPAFIVPVAGTPSSLAAIASSTGRASLATPSGSTTTALALSNVTVVSNLHARANHNGGPAPTISVTWTTGSSSPSNVNQSVSFTATVTGSAGNGAPTGGAVEFFSDGAALSDCGGTTGILVTPGTSPSLLSTAVCATSVLSASAAGHAITAQYLGANDLVYDNSALSASVTQVVSALTPTVSVTPAPASPSPFNTSVNFTAALSGTLTPVTPTGTMTFALGGTTINACTQTVQANGTAACPIDTMAIGSNTVTATYSGDSNYVVAAPGSAAYTITKASPTLTVSASASPTVNAPVTFTATLTGLFTPTPPTGTIAFADNLTPIGACTAQGISASGANYVATCILSDLTAGPHSISAVYIGDGNFNTATSASLPITIGQAATTLTIAAPAASPVNSNATFTATLHGTFTPTTPTTGSAVTSTVDFIADAGTGNQVTLCSASVLVGAGAGPYTATCNSNVLNGSAHSISATYSGDTNFAGSSTTTSASYIPSKAATTLTIAAPAAGPVNSNATFTATLHGTFTPVTPTTGSAATSTVAFYADGSGTPITGCSASQLQAGTYTATCTTNSLNATAHSISATYSGDTSFATSSTTTSASYTPTKLTGTLATASSVGTSTTVGTSVTFTVTFTVSPVTPLAPGGNISFTINGAADARCPAVAINASQQATCVTNGLTAGNYQIGASYAGDTNFNTATVTAINLAVAKAAPTVGLTATSATTPAVVNEPVTFTATVPTPGAGAQTVLPTGTVTFVQGATTLCANAGLDTSNPPVATCAHSFPSPVAAPGTVTATYNGDSNFTSGTPGSTTGTVNTATTTTVIVSSGTVNVGQAVTYTTNLTPQFSAPPSYPQGTVTFTTNASPAPAGTCTTPLTVSATGTVANCTLTFSSGGPWNVSAQYTSSNANFSNSTSSTIVQAVNNGSLGINLTSNASPTSVNQPVTFSAAFTPAIPSPVPSGNVTYADNGTTLCTVAISGTGTIPNCTYTFTTAGSHPILASFPGSGSYYAASSNTLPQGVNKNQVATSVGASLSSASVNQQVTFTATLTAAAFAGATGTLAVPSGTVTFNATSSAGTISPCSNVTITNTAGVLTAQCQTTFATIGTYTVTAQYNGDTNFTQGTPSSTVVTVGTAGTAVTVTPPAGVTFYVNEATGVTFTASVTPNPTGAVSPTGSFTFTDSVAGTDVCIPQNVQPDGHGGATASCPIIFRSAGSHTLTAAYSGDTNFPKASNTSTISVNATHMSISTSSGGTVPANQAVTYTTTLTPAFAGAGATIPKGTVTFSSVPATALTGTCMPSVKLALDGSVPTCTLVFPSAGTFTITATFNPADTNFATNTSAGVTQVISKAPTTLVVASPAAVVTNQAVVLNAAFLPAITGTQPTGTVTYYDGAAAIAGCNVTLAAGLIPGCPTHFITAGTHNITAVYSGDANFNTQTSAIASQMVNLAPTTAVIASSTGAGATATSSVNQQVTFTATITPQFPAGTLAVPTGTVAFYDNNNLAAPICQGVSVAAQANGTSTATCAYTFTATGTNTISAAYSGDTNFVALAQLNSTPLTQTVIAPNTTIAVTPPASANVNQQVTFSIVITPTSKGVTVPTGKVTFTDTDLATQVCAPAPLIGDSASGTSSASCLITFLNAGPHTVKATYGGDNNFAAPPATPSNLTVGASTTALALGSSLLPASFATQTVTYTAKVTPTPNVGANLSVPPGTVTFTSTDGTVQAACKTPVALLPNGDGTASATCSATFPHLGAPAGSVNVSATYNDSVDSNFSTSTNALTQTVQDFNVSLGVVPTTGSVSTPTAIYVTPGYGTVKNGSVPADPWGAVAITSGYTLSTGYLNPAINITCNVYATITPDLNKPPLQDPTCTKVKQSAGQWQFAVNVGPTVPTGPYTVYFTTYDTRYNNLNLTLPQSVTLYVVAPSPTLSLGAGSQGTQNLTFNTALSNGGDTISTFACGQIIDSTGAVVPNTNLISCSGAAGQSVSGDSTSLPVTISTSSSTAQLAPSSTTMFAAAVFGLPLMALLGWFGTKKSPRRTLYRFLSMIVLLLGLSYATGCGGSFHTSAPPVQNGIQPGSYQVQVIATGSGATPKQYYAVVPLQVNAIQ